MVDTIVQRCDPISQTIRGGSDFEECGYGRHKILVIIATYRLNLRLLALYETLERAEESVLLSGGVYLLDYRRKLLEILRGRRRVQQVYLLELLVNVGLREGGPRSRCHLWLECNFVLSFFSQFDMQTTDDVPMRDTLSRPVNQLQSLARALFETLSSSQNPPDPPVAALAACDEQLAEALRKSRIHLLKQRRIEALLAEVHELDLQLLEIIETLGHGQKELAAIIEEGEEHVKAAGAATQCSYSPIVKSVGGLTGCYSCYLIYFSDILCNKGCGLHLCSTCCCYRSQGAAPTTALCLPSALPARGCPEQVPFNGGGSYWSYRGVPAYWRRFVDPAKARDIES